MTNKTTTSAFTEAVPGIPEVGFFMPPAEDSSNRVLNHVLHRINAEALGINVVLFRVQQPRYQAIENSPILTKKKFLHSDIFEHVVFPFQNEKKLENTPGRVLLSPELLAEKYPGRLRIQDVANINDPLFVATIRANSNLKMGFSVRNCQIFGNDIIDAFCKKNKNSLINLHPANLPGIRGLEGPFWTRVKGVHEYTTTMHVIDQGIDTGPILDYESQSVNGDEDKSVSAYTRDAAPDVAKMIYQEIHIRFTSGKSRAPFAHDTTQSDYKSMPTNADLLEAEKNGILFTDAPEQLQWILRHYTQEPHDRRTPTAKRDNAHHKELMERVWTAYAKQELGLDPFPSRNPEAAPAGLAVLDMPEP